jgi:hypothetical protein
MDRKTLQESTQGFQPSTYGRIQRSGETYVATERFTRRVVTVALKLYRRIERLDQFARLLRDIMEWALRRHHDYSIKERLGRPGAHYRDARIQTGENKGLVFEHVIPVRYLLNMLIHDRIPIELAMNPPTCLLRKEQDTLLSKPVDKGGFGLADRTPCPFNFWQRYQGLNIDIVTYDNEPIDQNNYTLFDHCQRFVVK